MSTVSDFFVAGLEQVRKSLGWFLHIHASGSSQVLVGSCRRGYVRPLRQDQARCGVPQRSCRKAGLGFELPFEIIVIGRNGRKLESASVLEVAVNV